MRKTPKSSSCCNRAIIVVIFVVFGLNLWLLTRKTLNSKKTFDDNIFCYSIKTPALPEISTEKLSKGNNIFFHETSCRSSNDRKIVISAREACAVESAARLHRNHTVYLLYLSPEVFKSENTDSDSYFTALQSYRNVKILHIDFEKYVNGTPVEHLYTSRKLQKSQYPTSHASDVLRLVQINKIKM